MFVAEAFEATMHLILRQIKSTNVGLRRTVEDDDNNLASSCKFSLM